MFSLPLGNHFHMICTFGESLMFFSGKERGGDHISFFLG